MKPMIIDGSKNSHMTNTRLWLEFLRPNGVRHLVPDSAVIRIHGNYMDVPTFDIERADVVKRPWRGRHRPYGSRLRTKGGKLPIKVRTYRIRKPLPKGILYR